jgi:uncharacterized protein YcbK (DUF882 family)
MKLRTTRRQFLSYSIAAATAVAAPAVARASTDAKHLALHNLHTGESLKTVFWAAGSYVTDALQEIDYVLRDFRNGEVKAIDRQLLEQLHRLHRKLDSHGPFNVISGYRSPETNAKLRQNGGGVAKKSLHMQGMAIDVALPDRELKVVRKAALAMKAGGVGYYPKSGFVHLDTGRVRFW